MQAKREPGYDVDLGFVMVWVDDVKRTVEFYEALGLKKRYYIDTEDGGYAEFGTQLGGAGSDEGSTRLAFSGSREAVKVVGEGVATTPSAQQKNPVQLRFVADDIDSVYRKALSAGAEKVSEPEVQPWGSKLARFRDPNGILISIVTRLAPHNQARRLHELAGPVAVDALREPQRAEQLPLQNLPLGRGTPAGSDQLENLLGQMSDEDLARVFSIPSLSNMESAIISRL